MKGRPPEQSTSPPRRRVSSTPRIGRGRSGEKFRPDMACERVDCQQRACMVCGRGRCTESASCRGGPSCGLHGIGSAGSKAPGDLGTGRTAGAYTTLGTTSASIAGSTPAWCVGGEARRERAVPRRPKLWTLQAPRPWVTLLRVGTRGRQRPRAHQRSWHHRGSLGAAARDGCARSAPFARVGAREALRAEDAGRPGSGARIRSPYVSEDRRGRYIIPLGQERPKGPIGRQRGVRALPARKPQVNIR